ncbi:MAG TPA: hypothetical protein VFJ01_05520 [Oleiagrimonas sp.]|nr:hypothetical protein [Oleiagrimonas sp.]
MSLHAPDLAGWGFTPGTEPYARTQPSRRRTGASRRHQPGKRIAFWLGGLRYVPEVDEIVTRWDVSRSTAYRWRAFALRECSGRNHEDQT